MIQNTIVLVFLLTILYKCQTEYKLQCPHISQWNNSAESFQCPPTEKYMCLYHTLLNKFEEKCRPEDRKAQQGYTYELKPNPDKIKCPPEYYQPIIFTSSGNSRCIYKKSLCNEEGQIVATNGTAVSDRTCRCDFTRNYVYVTPPNDIDSCKPSEEDCSCYHRPCPRHDQIMISDYRCIKLPIWHDITTRSLPPTTTNPTERTTYTGKQFSDTRVSTLEATGFILTCAGLFIIPVLIICVNVRPHITKITVEYREDLIVTENNGKSITVIEGESLQLKCEFTSNFPSILAVKSIAWQHKKFDGNVQPVPSNEHQASALTIDNLNYENHSGKYECLLTNKIGLSNTTYERWFCNIPALRDLPAFIPEEHNCMDIYVCGLPDDYDTVDVHNGEDTTLEITEETYTRVIWFRFDRELEKIKATDKYTLYTNNKHSLTVKAADLTDAGLYVCMLVDGLDKVESRGFKLRVIPQEVIYNQVIQHRNDSTYVKTADVDRAMKCLHQYGTVFLSGREGTGKTKMCLQLASLCEKMDYVPYLVDLAKDPPEYLGPSKVLYIIDYNDYNPQVTEQLRYFLNNFLSQEQIWLIFTYRKTDLTNDQIIILQENNLLKEDNLIDLNNSLTKEEKKHILKVYMKANNIAESSSKEANFRMKEVLENKEIQVKIDKGTIEEIIKTNPFYGFPLTAVTFCKDRKLLYLGKMHFTSLPESLEVEINRIADSFDGEYTTYFSEDNLKYCILAYIASDKEKSLEMRGINIKRFAKLLECLYKKHVDHINIKGMIKDAIKDLDQFLTENRGRYTFVHPYVLATVYASHVYFTEYLMTKGTYNEIKEFIRSSKYQKKYGETVCLLDYSRPVMIKMLCKRLVTVACIGEDNLKDVGMYMYEQFIKLEDNIFRDQLISYLESKIYTEIPFEKGTTIGSSFRRFLPKGTAPEIKKKEDTDHKVSFWQTVLLMDELSDHGTLSCVLPRRMDEPQDYIKEQQSGPLKISVIILLCGMITTCLEKRKDTEYKQLLLLQFKKLEYEAFCHTLKQSVDIYGNTFFHYLAVLSEEESCFILKVGGDVLSKDNRSIFCQSNKMNLTPLDMAAYLGKLQVFKLLLDKTDQSFIDINRGHLLELTEEGRRFRYHNTKGSTKGKLDSEMFEEGLLKYIQYGKEKDFLDIIDLHKTTSLKKTDVRNYFHRD